MPRMRPVRPSAAARGPRRPPRPVAGAVVPAGDHTAQVSFSPAGDRVAAVDLSGGIVVATADGAPLTAWTGHDGGAVGLDWAPDGSVLATCGEDGRLVLWDPADGTALAAVESRGWAAACAFSRTGEEVAVVAGRTLRVADRHGIVTRDLADHPSTLTGLAWEPRGDRIAVSHYGGVSIWSPGAPEAVRLRWTGSSLCLAWSPDGRHIATGDQDATVHLWIVARREDLMMSGYATKVEALAWDGAGRRLATGGGADVTVWDCAPPGPAGSRPAVVEGAGGLVTAIAALPGRDLIAFGTEEGEVAVTPFAGAGPVERVLVGHGISALAASPRGNRLAAGLDDGGLLVVSLGD